MMSLLEEAVVNRYMTIAGTVRFFNPDRTTTDIPTILRLDTKTGQAWFLEGLQAGGIQWVAVTDRSAVAPLRD
jgi:hypothetical protein